MNFLVNPTFSRTNPAALCQLTPIFGEAVRQAHQNYQAPYSLCLINALAASSSAAQSLVDMVMPYGEVVPMSLYLVGIANSGERKSTVERRFMKEVKDVDDNLESDYKSDLVEFKVATIAYRAEKRRFEKTLIKANVDAKAQELIKENLRKLL